MIQLTERQQRKQASARIFKAIRRKQARISGRQPERDPKYLAFIRQFACIVCTKGLITAFRGSCSVAAHVGQRGLRQKCSDKQTLPLCPVHHDHGQPESHHTLQKAFFQHHGLDRDGLISDFNELYEQERA